MRCPSLDDLPPPPRGRVGWPWTEQCHSLPDFMPNGEDWPRVTIVTASFNQGQYIEETIRSVLLQGSNNLAYMVFDGASSDQTVEVLKKYERWLTWASEPDEGQADAINKGMRLASGQIFQFINSDDILRPGALGVVATAFRGADAVAGGLQDFGESGYRWTNRVLEPAPMLTVLHDASDTEFHQPGVWLNLERARKLGEFPTEFTYLFDLHYLSRYFEIYKDIRYLDEVLVNFRMHPASKTMAHLDGFIREHYLVRKDLSSKFIQGENRRVASRSANIMQARYILSQLEEGGVSTAEFYRQYLALCAGRVAQLRRRESWGALLRPVKLAVGHRR